MNLILNNREIVNGDIIPNGIYVIKSDLQKIRYITINGIKYTTFPVTAELAGKTTIKINVKLLPIGTKTYTYNFECKHPFRIFAHHNNYTAKIKCPREFLKFERNVIFTNQWWDFWPENRNCATEMDLQPIDDYPFLSQIQKDIVRKAGYKNLRELSKDPLHRALAESIREKIPTNESVAKRGLEWAYFNDEIVDVDLEYYWSQFKGQETPNNYWYGGVGKITQEKINQIKKLAQESIDRIKWVKSQATEEQSKRLKYLSYLPTIVFDFLTDVSKENWNKIIFENYISAIAPYLDYLGIELYRNTGAEGAFDQFLKKCQYSIDVYKTLNKPIIPFIRPNFDLNEQKQLFNLIYDNKCAGVIWWEDRHIDWTEKDQQFAQYIQNYAYRSFE